MIELIKKDVTFCFKYIILISLVIIITPFLIILEGREYLICLSFIIPLMVIGILLGKICYIEDSEDVRIFLKSLPCKKSMLIISKYIELLILVVFCLIYSISIQYIYKMDYDLSYIIKINIIISCIFMIYYSIYLLIYFKNNYYAAQNTIWIILIVYMGGMFLLKRLLSTGIQLSLVNNNYLVIAFILLTIILVYISLKIAIKKNR